MENSPAEGDAGIRRERARAVYRHEVVLNKDRRSAIAKRAAAAAAGCVLAGCVLERVMATHDQLCASSPREVVVALAPGEGYRVTFWRPTLTRDDVEWLAGVPPTRVVPEPGGMRLVYVASPAGGGPAAGTTLTVELVLRNVDGVPKLAAALAPQRFAVAIPRELVDRAVDAACHPEISLAPPGARFDIAAIDPAAFPDAARLVALMGPPHARTGDTIEWSYCLEPCDARARPVARFRYRFDADGRWMRAEFAWFRYLLVADRAAGTATLSLNLP